MTEAFRLYQSLLPDYDYYGRGIGGPCLIMMDNTDILVLVKYFCEIFQNKINILDLCLQEEVTICVCGHSGFPVEFQHKLNHIQFLLFVFYTVMCVMYFVLSYQNLVITGRRLSCT